MVECSTSDRVVASSSLVRIVLFLVHCSVHAPARAWGDGFPHGRSEVKQDNIEYFRKIHENSPSWIGSSVLRPGIPRYLRLTAQLWYAVNLRRSVRSVSLLPSLWPQEGSHRSELVVEVIRQRTYDRERARAGQAPSSR